LTADAAPRHEENGDAIMNSRREFLAAGGAFAALSALQQTANADSPRAYSVYLHGMVWNRQLPAPQSDWLLRFDARAVIPIGHAPAPPVPGFATFGDDIHDLGSHVAFQTATLHGDELKIDGTITESKNPTLVGLAVSIHGKVVGTAVQDLTVTIGGDVFSGAGLLVVIAIIAILIAM
jgi:hypothetical protein